MPVRLAALDNWPPIITLAEMFDSDDEEDTSQQGNNSADRTDTSYKPTGNWNATRWKVLADKVFEGGKSKERLESMKNLAECLLEVNCQLTTVCIRVTSSLKL